MTPADLPAIVTRARAVRPLKGAEHVHRPLLLSTLTAATASAADVPALVAEVEALRTGLAEALSEWAACNPDDAQRGIIVLLRAMLPTKGPTRAV